MKKNPVWILMAMMVLLVAVACGGGGGEQAGGGDAAPADDSAADSGSTASAPAAGGGGGTGSATISGKIAYSGDDPDTEITMSADPNCLTAHTEPVFTQKVEGAEGSLANVFVYVKSGVSGSFDAPADPVVLDQQGCQYSPHVFGVQTGQTLIIRNSDETLHNVHATPDANTEFNQGQPFQNMEISKTFDKVEVMVPFKCDVHPWMSAYMGVLDHPFFAVSGEDGSFSIGNLPAGTYTVEAWHETQGAQTMEVTVGDGETAEANFDLS